MFCVLLCANLLISLNIPWMAPAIPESLWQHQKCITCWPMAKPLDYCITVLEKAEAMGTNISFSSSVPISDDSPRFLLGLLLLTSYNSDKHVLDHVRSQCVQHVCMSCRFIWYDQSELLFLDRSNPLIRILVVTAVNNLSSIACNGCHADVYQFELLWHSAILTHTAATVILIVNNSSNITKTSTIEASSFVLPESAAGDGAVVVPSSIYTTTIGGTEYTL